MLVVPFIQKLNVLKFVVVKFMKWGTSITCTLLS